jgi:carbon monoxide dehydrogenase subunit G
VELSHTFTVPATVDQTWATFMDLPLVGGCFPGATVTEVTEEGFAGTVKVKLGPIALVYAGTGAFVERDDGAHRAVIEAKGKDKRGNGTAGATVTIALTDAGGGSTRADVQTDLAVTGKPAQFGRGVMQDVSDKLLGQFIACIEGKLSPVADEPDAESADEPGGGPADQAAPARTTAPARDTAPAGDTAPARDTAPAAGTAPSLRSVPPTPPPEDRALDLGSAVLPVLLKSYGKQIAGALVVLLALVGLARRRRRPNG